MRLSKIEIIERDALSVLQRQMNGAPVTAEQATAAHAALEHIHALRRRQREKTAMNRRRKRLNQKRTEEAAKRAEAEREKQRQEEIERALAQL